MQFFTASGLPSEVALRYAVVFSENRIQRGMLLDLTKEYLFDMGIHIMGDVIAILKHAKHVHSQVGKDFSGDPASEPRPTRLALLSKHASTVVTQGMHPSCKITLS